MAAPRQPHRPGLALPRRLARGLTLIEVFTVLAVLAVLAALALPSLGALAQRHRLAAAAESLASDLAEARLEAARSGQVLWVRAEGADEAAGAGTGEAGSGPWCWVVATTASCGCSGPAPGEQTPDATSALPGCALRQVTAADHPGVRLARPLQAGFAPEGTPMGPQASGSGPGAAGSAAPAVRAELVSPAGERLQIWLGALGRARICVPAGQAQAGWRYPAC